MNRKKEKVNDRGEEEEEEEEEPSVTGSVRLQSREQREGGSGDGTKDGRPQG